MTITLKSKIEKHSIKLPEWVQIPDGVEIRVRIESEMTKEEKKSLAENLCGAWANDPSIDSIFEDIEKDRHNYHGRMIDLDASA
jgi:hypothetical protein